LTGHDERLAVYTPYAYPGDTVKAGFRQPNCEAHNWYSKSKITRVTDVLPCQTK